jgi:protein-tyrosine phosphatase
MNYIRTIISKNKKRFIDRKFNLDLTYITSRIIVMGYPTSFPQSVVRNSLTDVANFLNERHGKNYLLINLSNKKYDISKFEGKVEEYQIAYHMPPDLKKLLDICYKMKEYLEKDVSNTVCVNCRGGKGRAGTVVCCYFLYIKKFTDPEDVFNYYSAKRLYSGEGIAQRSQKRYINYFNKILTKKKISFPKRIKIISIELNNMYELYHNGYYIVEIWDFQNEKMKEIYFSKNNYEIDNTHQSVILKVDNLYIIEQYEDVVIKISYNETFFNKKLGKISFNTAFLEKKQNQLNFDAQNIDPDNLLKTKKISPKYNIKINIKILCNICPTKNLKDYCQDCKNFVEDNKTLYNNWIEVINHHDKYKEKEIKYDKNMLFGSVDSDDADYILEEYKKKKANKKNKYKEDENDDEEKNYYEENNDSNSSGYSEGEGYDEKSENNEDNNEENKEKNKLNDSFESECFIF